ncbi:putative Zf-FLZ domain-containing protein [Rosa chinensis]|uniref:Putative Zf-FLZ domain-containing protein n=1 Tax=Rosa chinensis TaxID=74649 RepID=A0A2P6PVU2_ROSCH|nr:FCS-Like Zinc finger 5 isoform X1 [Rosa chinensis]PRQ26057.1 putative Zf-FLZ domain-containing protein [Rosa chinensis]
MPTRAKRTRICSSPSSGEAGVIRQLPPKEPEQSNCRFAAFGNVVSSVKPSREEARRDHARPAILTVSSPEIVFMEPAAAQVDQFLDECYFCQKRIPQNADVFMYGLFGAFCSEVCRFQQIYKDKVAEQALVKSTRTAINGTKSNVNGS